MYRTRLKRTFRFTFLLRRVRLKRYFYTLMPDLGGVSTMRINLTAKRLIHSEYFFELFSFILQFLGI